MKKHSTTISFDKETILLMKDQVASLKRKQFHIKCLEGAVWVTWPKGAEQTLVSGQSMSGKSNGKVCISAFSNAMVQVEQKSVSWHGVVASWLL